MDREFYHRIKTKRADPSRQSVTNPAPDFYGEKVCVMALFSFLVCLVLTLFLSALVGQCLSPLQIVSIPTYRRWLKDQKAYDRKASHGVPGEDEE